MAEVIITKAQLEAIPACKAYLASPEWNGEALVYSDWDATAARLQETRIGMRYLNWLVDNKLVPMSREEYDVVRAAERQRHVERIRSL